MDAFLLVGFETLAILMIIRDGLWKLRTHTFTGPGWSDLDFSVMKDSRITETKTLQFRAEFFNIVNQATFGTPGESLGSSGFVISTGTQTSERQIQFGLC